MLPFEVGRGTRRREQGMQGGEEEDAEIRNEAYQKLERKERTAIRLERVDPGQKFHS